MQIIRGDNIIQRDAHGFILTGLDLAQNELRPEGWSLDRQPFLLETSVPGIFAAGDVPSWFYQENHRRSRRRIYSYSANTSIPDKSIK